MSYRPPKRSDRIRVEIGRVMFSEKLGRDVTRVVETRFFGSLRAAFLWAKDHADAKCRNITEIDSGSLIAGSIDGASWRDRSGVEITSVNGKPIAEFVGPNEEAPA